MPGMGGPGMAPPAQGFGPPPTPPTAAPPPLKAAEPAKPAPVAPERAPAQAGRREAPPGAGDALDYTKIPADLDKKFDELDEDASLHATILHAGDTWTKSAQKSLLTKPVTTTLGGDQQKEEKSKAFDLLDALTKSGALAIDDASLHVVLAATHSFDKTLLETIVQDNVNPIEKVERSLMIVGTTIFGLPASELLADDQRERFFGTSPRLRLPGPKKD
jgi:hypothetical protein